MMMKKDDLFFLGVKVILKNLQDQTEFVWVSMQEADQLLEDGYGCLVSELVKQ